MPGDAQALVELATLPVELHEQIMSHSDFKSLKSWALVSRAISHSARRRLWERLVISFTRLGGETLDDFLEAALREPGLVGCIRDLCFVLELEVSSVPSLCQLWPFPRAPSKEFWSNMLLFFESAFRLNTLQVFGLEGWMELKDLSTTLSSALFRTIMSSHAAETINTIVGTQGLADAVLCEFGSSKNLQALEFDPEYTGADSFTVENVPPDLRDVRGPSWLLSQLSVGGTCTRIRCTDSIIFGTSFPALISLREAMGQSPRLDEMQSILALFGQANNEDRLTTISHLAHPSISRLGIQAIYDLLFPEPDLSVENPPPVEPVLHVRLQDAPLTRPFANGTLGAASPPSYSSASSTINSHTPMQRRIRRISGSRRPSWRTFSIAATSALIRSGQSGWNALILTRGSC